MLAHEAVLTKSHRVGGCSALEAPVLVRRERATKMAARSVAVLPVAPPPLVHSKSAASMDLIFSGAETITFTKETLVRPELRIMQHKEAPAPPHFLVSELILFTRRLLIGFADHHRRRAERLRVQGRTWPGTCREGRLEDGR